MLVQHKKTDNKGMFYVETEGNILAEMTYSIPFPQRMVIEHTEVSPELKGQNVGYTLVLTAVEYARTHGMTIIPLCSFTSSVFKKKPEFMDVLEKN